MNVGSIKVLESVGVLKGGGERLGGNVDAMDKLCECARLIKQSRVL